MSVTLAAAVLLPYFISRHIYKENAVRFPWHHGRYWYFSEIIYIAVTACVAYFLLPYYLRSTGAYLNWPSASDMGSLVRLFIGTNALGFWDELFFVSTALGIMRRHFSFAAANIFQSVLFTSFLYDLGFKGWGFVMIFLFALLQGYIFKRTDSLLYVVTIHLTLDCILFLALIHAYHPMIIPIFISG
jgi:membrane protease YdiL (CAAX protease family)